MSGIGPLSKAYESFVLPLNYTGFYHIFAHRMVAKMPTIGRHLCKILVAGARIERASSGYGPDEIPLLHPAIGFSVYHFSGFLQGKNRN